MATEQHKHLANIIKSCHDSLRQKTQQNGPLQAWQEHTQQTKLLEEYATAMHELSQIWEHNNNTTKEGLVTRSRLQWIVGYCNKYFYSENAIILEKRNKEQRLLDLWPDYDRSQCRYMHKIPEKLNVLDVGSCFHPFKNIPNFKVTPIDLYPATDDVLKCDFLQVPLEEIDNCDMSWQNNEVKSLPRLYYECVIFSLLLEYLPTSQQRLHCCRKAYNVLRPEGVLIVITPDSQHVGKNAAIMKNWRYTLGCLGFNRIRFEKLPHITCMVFRKTCDPRLAYRWSELHRESYMTLDLQIPQDNKTYSHIL